MSAWSPYTWKEKPIVQDVVYEDPEHVQRVLGKLQKLPPLVSAKEIDDLRDQLEQVALGNSFLLQGGDCAELFDYCSQDPIEAKLKVLLQMSLVLVWGGRTPVTRIARMAGQYAKPRSKPTEMHNGEEILSYRGDNVNGYDPADRKPDPERLLGAYFHSAATLNYVRTLLDSGFADLHEPSTWNLSHVQSSAVRSEYEAIVHQLTDALDFMKTVGADKSTATSQNALQKVDLFVSHEALLLDYEASLTRLVEEKGKHYNLGSHFLWIGDRTRQPDGAHVEYMRGIANPVGIKVGPTTDPANLVQLLNTVNPEKAVGKVTLITRFGAGKVEQFLPQHIVAVRDAGHKPVWVCDPMHGNTKTAVGGIKTRHFVDIIQELSEAFRVHKDNDSKLNGVHFELTGDSVTECVGGSMNLTDADLSTNYQTHCDPRLNYEQALDVAFLIAKYYQKERRSEGFPSL
ncbi:DAHP synthetase [Gongronella butleri]|nr:DAHP synthetase [Gongronella butleri]